MCTTLTNYCKVCTPTTIVFCLTHHDLLLQIHGMISPYCSMSLPDHCIVLQVGRIFRTRVCEYHGIHIPNCGIVRTYRDTCNTRVVPYQGKVIRYCSMGRHVSLSRACSVRYYHGSLLTIYSIRIAYYGFHVIYQGITRHVSLFSVIYRYTCQNYYLSLIHI